MREEAGSPSNEPKGHKAFMSPAAAPLPDDEAQRLAALRAYQILDTEAEAALDELTALAADLCGAPIALITLVDSDRQWFKSRIGLDISETSRDVAFCAHAILHEELFVVTDASRDERFAHNPLVLAEPRIRFYAGAPLINPDGYALGTLCVIDRVPRNLDESQHRALRILSHHVVTHLELRRLGAELMRSHEELEDRVSERTAEVRQLNEELQRDAVELERRVARRTSQLELANQELAAFSYSVSHDLRAPLRAINGFSKILLDEYGATLDPGVRDYIERIHANTAHMGDLIDALLSLSRVTRAEPSFEPVDLSAMAATIVAKLRKTDAGRSVEVLIAPNVVARGDARLLEVALENLLSNAWKFTSRQAHARIEFGVTWTNGQPVYFVRDDGAGFDQSYANKLFKAFQRLHTAGEFEGTGIGLATVQRVIDRHGGRIWSESAVNEGATFYFTLAPAAEAPVAANG